MNKMITPTEQARVEEQARRELRTGPCLVAGELETTAGGITTEQFEADMREAESPEPEVRKGICPLVEYDCIQSRDSLMRQYICDGNYSHCMMRHVGVTQYGQ